MFKHLFYSLLLTFLLVALAEFVRPGFATNFLNTNILFIFLLATGCLMLVRRKTTLDK